MVCDYFKKIILRWPNLTGFRIPVKYIRAIDIEPVAACNLKCPFCQVPGWRRAIETTPMTLEVFEKIINQFPGLMWVKIQGMGEPFLNRQLPDFLAYCTGKRIKTVIISNGTLLTKAMGEKIIDSGLSEIYFSFDGATRETYESLRVGANFEEVLGNIRGLCELKKARNSNIRIGMVCLVSTEQVLKELPRYVQMAFDNGVREVQIKKRLKNWKKADNSGTYVITSMMKVSGFYDYNKYFEQAKEKARCLGVRLTITSDSDFSFTNPCPWPWCSVYISAEGKVIPCCTIGIPETWCMGDLRKENIRKIWNNASYRMLRRDMKKNSIRNLCKPCYGINAEEGRFSDV